MGLGDFLEGAGKAAVNTVKAGAVVAEHVADPTKWDDAARAVGNVGEAAWEHRGQIADVAWDIAKDQVNPTKADFWINAGTLAVGAATGGTGAAALTAIRAGRAARVADKAVDTVRAVDKVSDLARAADKANDVRKLGAAEKIAVSRTAQLKGGAREALGLQRLGPVQRGRVAASDRILGAADEASTARKMVARSVAGQKGVMPSQRAGRVAETATDLTDTMWTGRRLQARGLGAVGKTQGAGTYVNVMKDPGDYALRQGQELLDQAGGPQAVMDRLDGRLPDLVQPPRPDGQDAARSSLPGIGRAPAPSLLNSSAAQMDTMRVGYGNQYTPRGWEGPGQTPKRTAVSSEREVYDPYQKDERQQQGVEVRDPYAARERQDQPQGQNGFATRGPARR